MAYRNRKQSRSLMYLAGFIGWLVMNIRVEAGIGTVFERALDGMVGVLVLLATIILVLKFLNDGVNGQGRGGDRYDR